MTDWADEIANGFCSAGLMDAGQVLASDKSPEHYAAATNLRRDREASERKQLASALRAAELRGRVKGMREAAEIAHRLEDQFETVWRKGLKGDSHLEGMSDGASQVSDAIFEAASKLSPTT